MKLYTALGRYTMKESVAGEKIPHVIIGDTTHELDLWEMIVWSSLIWNIYTYDEICRDFYKKEKEAHILGDLSCDDYLKHMEQKGLIAVGEGVTGIDALHNLISGLYVIPVTANLFTKTAAFLHPSSASSPSVKGTKTSSATSLVTSMAEKKGSATRNSPSRRPLVPAP